jgi:peptidoglycan hydrolase CwlO-like protein
MKTLAFLIALTAALLLPNGSARAQAAPDPLQQLGADWSALTTSLAHVSSDVQVIVKQLQDAQAKIQALEAEVKRLTSEKPKE